MTNASVTWDGEGICVIILVVLARALTVQATGCVTQQFTYAPVTKAGLAKAAKFPTVQAHLTASSEEFVTRQLIPQNVKTAVRAGWVRLVTILASTVNKFQWTAVTVSASPVG